MALFGLNGAVLHVAALKERRQRAQRVFPCDLVLLERGAGPSARPTPQAARSKRAGTHGNGLVRWERSCGEEVGWGVKLCVASVLPVSICRQFRLGGVL